MLIRYNFIIIYVLERKMNKNIGKSKIIIFIKSLIINNCFIKGEYIPFNGWVINKWITDYNVNNLYENGLHPQNL